MYHLISILIINVHRLLVLRIMIIHLMLFFVFPLLFLLLATLPLPTLENKSVHCYLVCLCLWSCFFIV